MHINLKCTQTHCIPLSFVAVHKQSMYIFCIPILTSVTEIYVQNMLECEMMQQIGLNDSKTCMHNNITNALYLWNTEGETGR